MRRTLLIVLLSAGTIGGFAHGFRTLRYGHGGWGHSCHCSGNMAASQPSCY